MWWQYHMKLCGTSTPLSLYAGLPLFLNSSNSCVSTCTEPTCTWWRAEPPWSWSSPCPSGPDWGSPPPPSRVWPSTLASTSALRLPLPEDHRHHHCHYSWRDLGNQEMRHVITHFRDDDGSLCRVLAGLHQLNTIHSCRCSESIHSHCRSTATEQVTCPLAP